MCCAATSGRGWGNDYDSEAAKTNCQINCLEGQTMTMPSERTRALRWAGEFLREAAGTP